MAIKLSTLKLHKSNPRTISDSALNKLCESIKRDPEFMELRPIIVDADNVIVAGNQRYKACKKNGMAEVPDSWVVKAENLSKEKLKRLMIIDNSPEGMSGEWDLDSLKLNWSTDELESLGFALELESLEQHSENDEFDPDFFIKDQVDEKTSARITFMSKHGEQIAEEMNDLKKKYEGFNVYF